MGQNSFEGIEGLMTGIAVVVAAIFCALGAFFIKVDVFAKFNPGYPPAKRVKHFHRKFGITFIVFALVWLALFVVAIYQ